MPDEALTIYTIGHSTHTVEHFLELLRAHQIALVADIRTVPKSRRHPHFVADALEQYLAAHAIDYCHLAALGGLRKPRRDSVNTAWRHPGFRGYADHMETKVFTEGVERLLFLAKARQTTIMCAEALWWRCHRQLVADALVVRGVRVLHIMSNGDAKPHRLSEFARTDGIRVTYPGLL